MKANLSCYEDKSCPLCDKPLKNKSCIPCNVFLGQAIYREKKKKVKNPFYNITNEKKGLKGALVSKSTSDGEVVYGWDQGYKKQKNGKGKKGS